MRHQWPQFDHHDATLSFKLTNDEERKTIAAWQQSESFDDVIVEAQQSMNIKQG